VIVKYYKYQLIIFINLYYYYIFNDVIYIIVWIKIKRIFFDAASFTSFGKWSLLDDHRQKKMVKGVSRLDPDLSVSFRWPKRGKLYTVWRRYDIIYLSISHRCLTKPHKKKVNCNFFVLLKFNGHYIAHVYISYDLICYFCYCYYYIIVAPFDIVQRDVVFIKRRRRVI